ncbi:MAG: hypothetical protein HYT98_04905 [Candidatus Sungbacteria bacterium]|nr:hypothetical protein [Candidatus Sungbacteria bacterium]
MEEPKKPATEDERSEKKPQEIRRPVRKFSLSRTDSMVLDRERKDLFERDWSQLK